jgi:Mce-associated membrane protein
VALAAVRTNGVTVVDSAEMSAPSNRKSTAQLIVTAVILAALVITAVLLGLRDHRRREASSAPAGTSAEQAVLSAARSEAVALTTLSYNTAAADLNRILAGATGQLRTQFEKEKAQLPATLAQTKSVSRGSVLSSGLISLDGARAQALAAVDARVSGTDTGRTGVIKHYRMVITLQQVGSKWLASDVAFAGVPQ